MDQTAIQPEARGPKPTETVVQAGSPPVSVNGATVAVPDAHPKAKKQPKHPVYQLLERLADLRITVVLFALALVLVFWGTLAQVDFGVWTIVQKYFRSLLVLVPLRVVLFNSIGNTDIVLPFPGGWLIGGAMLVNLLAAHAIRFKLAWNRAGIILIHAGIIVMMLGEFITGVYAVEGNMVIRVGQTVNSVVDARHAELAIIRTLDPKKDEVVLVPARLLKTGAVVDDEKVPFKIEVIEYMVNSNVEDDAINKQATRGFGRFHLAHDVPEVSGVDTGQKIDFPSAYLKLSTHDGKDLGTWLVSTHFVDPQFIEVAGKAYKISLRLKQTTRNFTLHLTKFDHKVFPSDPNKTKDYRSYIHLTDKDSGVERDVQIYMNAPLYYRGETFYQSGMDRDERGVIISTLQVVRNPGWMMPYISCAIVGCGMLIHFGFTLFRFISRRILL